MEKISYKCPRCDATFSNLTAYIKHLQEHETSDKEDAVKKKKQELDQLCKEIMDIYEKLKLVVNKYNAIAENKKYTCTLSSESKEKNKETRSVSGVGLDDLIKIILGE